MTEAKNDWIGTEVGRAEFFGTLTGKPPKGLGLTAQDAKTAFGVTSTKDIPLGLNEALDFIAEWKAMESILAAEHADALGAELAEVPEDPPAEVQAEVPQKETAITVTEKPDITATEWAGRQDIDVLGSRIKAMLPGGDKLSVGQARALAQYSLVMGANPFRGEVYAYEDRSGFHIVEGYKLLVRWAMRQSKYSETYTLLENLPEGDIGFRCRILRDDRTQVVKDLTEMGAEWQEAYDTVSVFADGVVTVADRTTKAGKAMDAPRGWTWEQVARKRALKNALNLSHGAPSLKEIAEETWMAELPINGTTPELAAQWKVESEKRQREHPELFKGTRTQDALL